MKSPLWLTTLRQWSACVFTTWPRPHPLSGGSSHSVGSSPHRRLGLSPGGGRVCRAGEEPRERSSPGGRERAEALEVTQQPSCGSLAGTRTPNP